MKQIEIKRLTRVEVPEGEYEDIVAFQMVEFKIEFYGVKQEFRLDTIFTKSGKQLVKDGNGFIPAGFDITSL